MADEYATASRLTFNEPSKAPEAPLWSLDVVALAFRLGLSLQHPGDVHPEGVDQAVKIPKATTCP